MEEEFEDTKGQAESAYHRRTHITMDKRKSTKGKRIYILDRSGNHQKITPNQGVTSGAGTAYPSGAPEFTPGFYWGSVYSIFGLTYTFCRSLFVLLGIVLSVLLRFMDSD